MPLTVMEVLNETAKRYEFRTAMCVKRNGQWQSTTWGEYREQARLVARALIALGTKAGQGVAIIGFNSPEWLLADVGAIFAGAVPAGIYTTSSHEQCQYIASHCDAAVAFVENETHAAKFLQIRDQLPELKAIVQLLGEPKDSSVLSWKDFLSKGKDISENDLESRITAQKEDDVCTLIYTSGTTGNPKGVMISHKNLVWTSDKIVKLVNFTAEDSGISYLPLSHIAEQVLSIHGPMRAGACIWFAESIESLPDNLREVRPTFFFGVPRVWEKMQAKIAAAGAKNPPLRKKIAAWARKQGLAGGKAEQKGLSKGLGYTIANKLVFSAVRERIGLDRARFMGTGAAPISLDTLEFFLSLGIRITEVYGMSECTGPGTVSLPERYRTGKAGFILPGTELKIAEDGEILMRGPHVFKGYFKNPEATKETIDEEGWLHSGDVGEVDTEGFLKITDRKKDLIITAGGENIAPQVLEGELKSISPIAQAVVLGDRKKYLTALLTLDPERLPQIASQIGSPAQDVKTAATCPTLRRYLEEKIEGMNGRLARVQTIKKFEIIPGEFTIDGGELTPTMKVKRKVVNQKYSAEIEKLYAE